MTPRFSSRRSALLIIVGVLLALGVARPAHTQQAGSSTYNVEVIVFRTSGAREGEPGVGPARAASGEPGGGAPSGSVTQAARFIGSLPASRLQLAGARQRLTAVGYRVLAHAGWTQTASSWGSRSGLPLDRLSIQVPGLSGSFFLERGALLHLGMNLRYVTETGAVHQLSEIRRVRLNEKNYYDHPGIGVIAVVTQGAR